MGSVWLTDLGNVVRAAGLSVVEYHGWQSRSRESGGLNAVRAIIVHHTASNPGSNGQADADYIAETCDFAPIVQLYLERSGLVWVIAAGACNHAGEGGPLGPLPVDDANRHAIGIEAANNGVGEPWPAAQTESYQALVRALCAHYGVPHAEVYGHCEWAPARKIDPAGASPWATGSATWNMHGFRSDLGAAPDAPPSSPPPPFPGTARLGDYGPVVLTWQDTYIAHGVIHENAANRDGYYGPGMEDATRTLQRSWGWSDADGVAGSHTWAHLTTDPCATCGL